MTNLSNVEAGITDHVWELEEIVALIPQNA
jgi:hypothetical protein